MFLLQMREESLGEIIEMNHVLVQVVSLLSTYSSAQS